MHKVKYKEKSHMLTVTCILAAPVLDSIHSFCIYNFIKEPFHIIHYIGWHH